MFPSRPSRLSARARFPASTVSRAFGVYWQGQGFTPTHHACSALPHGLPRRRRSCEILSREPAISDLDWLFTPRPESEERIARHDPFGPPPEFPPASTCSGLDRPVSGARSVAGCGVTTPSLTENVPAGEGGTSPPSEPPGTALRLRTFGFPAPQRLEPLKLATTRDSPARDSGRNLRHCSAGFAVSLALTAYAGFRAFMPKGNWQACFRLFSQTSRPSFRLSFRVLVHYRIPDVFRLGRSALPSWAGNSGPTYSFSGCQRVFAYGTVALFGCLFQENSARRVEALSAPHLRTLSGTDSARPLPVSLAVTSGIAVAFFSCPYYNALLQGVPVPRPTSTARSLFRQNRVHSRRLAGAVSRDAAVDPRHEVAFGDPRIEGCMHLPGEYRCLPRPSSAPGPSHPHACVCVSDSSHVGVNPDMRLSARSDDWDRSR